MDRKINHPGLATWKYFASCTSSDAIPSDVITASFSGGITPQRTFSLRKGFFLSFRLNTLDLTWFLYLGLVDLWFLKIVSSMSSASSSGVLTVPSGSSPSPKRGVVTFYMQRLISNSPLRAVARSRRQPNLTSSAVADAL
jgi:hypothetical protein